jgi:alpha-mannosidase
MKVTELVVLLPCHSLEDFPTYHTGEAAEGLLAAWSALWHPTLLAAALKTPVWRRIDDPPAPADGMLIVVPTVADDQLPENYAASAAEAGAGLIQGLHRRKDILERALAAIDAPGLEASDAGNRTGDLGSGTRDLGPDFLAVGLGYLLTELLTRRMRYMSNLNESSFQANVLAAASAAARGDFDTARECLGRCCEALFEARAHYYPVDTYLLDLTLLAPTTVGASLRGELASASAMNILASGEVIEQMAEREPATLSAVRERLSAQTLALVGGEHHEVELPLLPYEEMLVQLECGRRAYQRHVGVSPTVFGRRRFGLTPALPQILRGLGFKGALHFTLDDGRFPQGERSKTMWEGNSYTAIDAAGRVPLDAGQAASILTLPEKLGESMDYDHVSMVSFAHWPGLQSEYYEDLRRISKYSPVLGKFVTADEFFASTDSAGTFSRFTADEYRSPYLVQAVQSETVDPISTCVRRRMEERQREVNSTLRAWSAFLSRRQAFTSEPEPAAANPEIAAALTAGANQNAPKGLLLVNPLSFTRRAVVDISGLSSPPTPDGPVIAIDANAAVVEVPPLGFAWIGPGPSPKKGKPPTPIAQENKLVNDRCEVAFHPETGGIRSVRDLNVRGNRLSQQLAFRLPDSMPMPVGIWRDRDDDARYAQAIADSIAITSNSSVLGEITSRGRLLHPDGRELATFVQATRLAAGRTTVEIDIDLEPIEHPRADPWSSYYACRFAWPDDLLSELRRSVHGTSCATDNKRLEAPDFIEVVGKGRTAILTGGLPYHLRIGPRMLDSLLVVHGETARRFRLGIAIENPYPWQAALDLAAPLIPFIGQHPPPAGAATGWLFHIDAGNVVATHWSPLVEGKRVAGFCLRLLECAGHGGAVSLRALRGIASARRTNFLGEPAEDLPVEGDRVRLDISAYEWLQLEARWVE